jgi:hypothetical protein
VLLAMLLMYSAETLGDEHLDRLAQQVLGGVPKERLGRLVDQLDVSTGIQHQGGVRGQLYGNLDVVVNFLPVVSLAAL